MFRHVCDQGRGLVLKSDLISYQECFGQDGFVQLGLQAEFESDVNKISHKISAFHQDEWSHIIKNSIQEQDYFLPIEQTLISYHQSIALHEYQHGAFCFSFKRIVDNPRLCHEAFFNKIKAFFCTETFLNFLEKICQRRVKEMSSFYISRFDQGDFLTTHCDAESNIAVVLNLTRRWNPNHGGLTCILDQTRNRVIETLTPTFGNLFIFDTLEKSIPHFVSMVTVTPEFPRVAISVRYQ